MMPPMRFQILNPLGRRQNQYHRNDGHSTETLEGEWHILYFYGTNIGPFIIRQDTAQFV